MTMLPFCATPQDCGPESLLDLCFKYIIQHLNIVCSVDPFTKDYHLIDGLALPRELCEKLIEVYQKSGKEVSDGFANIFQNPHTTRLKRVRLRNSPITDDGLKLLLRHDLVELDLSNCSNITGASLTHINEHGNSLVSLIFGSSVNILPETVVLEELRDSFSVYHKRGYVLRTPNLQRLAVRNVFIGGDKAFFQLLVRPLHKLVHLDLSNCLDLGPDLSYLTELKYLTSLVLHNVQRLQESLPSICQLKQLRHLDISQATEKQGIFRNENQMLALLVESLPNLVSLDISGTNLAGTGVAEHSPNSKDCKDSMPQTDIPGLSSRVNNPFEFLGLYGTHHAACRRHDIPARNIAGDLNEVQIFNAAAANIDRPAILQKVLNDLYHLFRYETCHDPNYAMKVVLEAMDRHLGEKHIQISGSATLFYIVKGKDRNLLDMKTKQLVIGTLLNGMNMYRDDDTMMRNGCLTLCQFRIPDDVLFDYRRLVSILLHIVSEMEQEGFVQRIGIYLLNSLACQVDGFQKQLLGDLGAISRMLGLIEDRLARRVCDDVLEVAWSTMWNVTDETAVNCKRFLDGGGMEFFLGCLSVFPEKEELLRNMMGLLGNVAEVQSLRPRLMTKQFVSVFAELLDSSSDGIEVSYNAAGVLSHMASDGPAAWTLDCPRREDVLQRMVHAIERWYLETERNINYRSFEPILHLAKMYHTPECQHWAVWALANLTKVYPAKYCYLVEAEGGLSLLMEIIQNEKPYMRIKELAMQVIRHCREFKEKGYLASIGQLDG